MLQNLVITESASLEILFNKEIIKLKKHKKGKNKFFIPKYTLDTYLKIEKKEKMLLFYSCCL